MRPIYNPDSAAKAYWRKQKSDAEAAVQALRTQTNQKQPARSRTYRKTQEDYDAERDDAEAARNRVLAEFTPYYQARFRGKSEDRWDLRTAGETQLLDTMYWM